MPVGQTCDAGIAIHAVAVAFLAPSWLAARLAAPVAVGDDQRVLVQHGRLEARPGAHVGADLLARPAGQQIGRGGEQADEEIDLGAGLAGEHVAHHRRRVVEVHDPGAAGRHRDAQPDGMLGDLLAQLGGGPGLPVQLHAGVAVALDQPLDPHEQVGPDRLRAGEAAPDAAEQAGRQRTGRWPPAPAGRSGNRPPAARSRSRRRTAGRCRYRPARPGPAVRPAVPADQRDRVVEPEAEGKDQPLRPPHRALDRLGVDLLARGIERRRSRRRPPGSRASAASTSPMMSSLTRRRPKRGLDGQHVDDGRVELVAPVRHDAGAGDSPAAQPGSALSPP